MIKEFLKSKIFFKNLALSFVAFILLILFVSLVLNFYTRHGSEEPLPRFIGMELSKAEVVMDDLGLRYEVTDSVYDIKMVPGQIYDQHPIAGSQVKSGRMVRLSIYSSTPVMTTVPDLTDQSYRNAQGELLERGLTIGKVTYVPSSFTNLVLEQRHKGKLVEAGTRLPKGSTIDLVIGRSGEEGRTKVPDLMGLTLKEANSYAKGVSLNIGTIVFDSAIKSSADSLNAVVYKQSPLADESNTVTMGSNVDIWLTTDYSKLNQ